MNSLCCFERILVRKVGLYVVVERISVVLRAHVIVLAERIAHKIAAQVEAAHVGVSEELDAEEVEHLALEQVGRLPEVAHCGDDIVVTNALGHLLHRQALVGIGVLKNVYTPEALLAEVFADDSNKVVKMLVIPQLGHFGGEAVLVEY